MHHFSQEIAGLLEKETRRGYPLLKDKKSVCYTRTVLPIIHGHIYIYIYTLIIMVT